MKSWLLAFHVTGYLPHLCPDDDVFRHLAGVYARHHATMWKGQPCYNSGRIFPNGIINGAEWYTVTGNHPLLHTQFLTLDEITHIRNR